MVDIPEEKPEQTAIAHILTTVDKAIETTEQLIAKYERIKSGMMHDLLTKGIDENGQIRSEQTHKFKDSLIGRIPIEWEPKTLGKLIDIEHGWAFKGKYFADVPSNFILLTPGNFNVGGGLYFTEDNTKYYTGEFPDSYILSPGDVVIVMTDLTKQMAILGNTETIGQHRNILHNQRIGKIVLKSNDIYEKSFAKYLLNSWYCKKVIRATATGR